MDCISGVEYNLDFIDDAFDIGNCPPKGIYFAQFILFVPSNNSSKLLASNSATFKCTLSAHLKYILDFAELVAYHK